MKIESRVVAVSWIPSEAVKGAMKAPFELGIAHYDEPLPDVLGDLEDWRKRDMFRVANDLRAWIGVDDDGQITGYGYSAGGVIGSTTMGMAGASATFEAVAYPTLQPEPEVGDGWVRFQQTAGGRTGVPAPRRVAKPPFVQYHAPTAWSTLSLKIYADGRSEGELTGASPFPRHWVYGPDGNLAAKTGLVDFKDWYRHAFGDNSPWGGEDSPALVAEVESALERQLSKVIMGEGKPKVRKLKEGATLTKQGEEADAIYLLLDGVIQVSVDGEEIANLGPGALIGERAVLEGGKRTATLTAVSACKVAEARKVELDLDKLAEVSHGHRREEENRSVKVHVLGVRGSTPAPGHDFARHGGNTSCVALSRDDAPPSLLLDAGTGLRGLGALLGEQPFRGAMLLGHLHWDHTQGLPFSRAVDHDGAEVRVCIPDQEDGDSAIEVLRRAMSPPHFPIGPEGLRGAWTFESLAPGEHHAGGFEVLALEIPHKGGRTYGYRVSDGRSSIAYLSDHGPSALGPGPDGWGPYHDTALALAAGVDLLIHDAQHTAEELPARVSWGHSAADYPVRLAELAGAKAVLLFHHDPIRTDDEVDAIVATFADAGVPVTAAAEGTVLVL